MTTWQLLLRLLPIELWNTLYMVFVSALCSIGLGLPLGVILYQTREGGLTPQKGIYRLLSFMANIGRAIPFAILIVAMIPVTRWIVGTSIGTTAAIVPLTIAAIPFFARIVEGALAQVDSSVVQAALIMGSSTGQIIRKVVLPEALPGLIRGATLLVVTLIGYSTLAGLVGGGGLGKVAIQYGYQRFNGTLMIVTLVILLLLVEGVQGIGEYSARRIMRIRGLE